MHGRGCRMKNAECGKATSKSRHANPERERVGVYRVGECVFPAEGCSVRRTCHTSHAGLSSGLPRRSRSGLGFALASLRDNACASRSDRSRDACDEGMLGGHCPPIAKLTNVAAAPQARCKRLQLSPTAAEWWAMPTRRLNTAHRTLNPEPQALAALQSAELSKGPPHDRSAQKTRPDQRREPRRL